MIRAKSPHNRNFASQQRISPSVKRNAELMYNKLNQLLFKKMRYTFQVLKQFYLFPEGSSSSMMSVEKYDMLIFNDEAIHTIAKKMETKVLEQKLWAFLNIKLMKILKQVEDMTIKINDVLKRKEEEHMSFGFEKIKVKAREANKKKKKTRDSASQTRISEEPKSSSRISIGSQKVISQRQQLSYMGMQPRVYIHRGSRSRSGSISPNSQFTRVFHEQAISIFPQEYRGNVQIHEVTPKIIIKKVTERSPAKHYYEVDQVKREYRNCYRIAPTRIRIVSCGCDHLLQKSCHCTALLNSICESNTCHHSSEGSQKCNSYHGHCSCRSQSSIRSGSKDKKTIKFIKSPLKKNPQENPPQNRYSYLNHLDSSSPKLNTFGYEYNETHVTHFKR